MKHLFSLRKVLLLFLITVVSILFVFFGAYLMNYIERISLDHFYSNKKTIFDIIYSNSVPCVELNLKSDLISIFNSLDRDKEFLGAVVYTGKKEVYARYIRNGSSLVIPDSQPDSFKVSGLYSISMPIHSEIQGNLGTLIIFYSQNNIIEETRNTLLRIGLIALILAFSIFVFMDVLMERLVLRPIDRLMTATQDIAGGNLEARVSLDGQKEFNDLAHNFNIMAHNLHQTIVSLENSNLEIRELQLFLDSIIENIPDTIISLDQNLRMIKLNPAALALFGWNSDEAVHQWLFEVEPGFKKYESAIHQVLQTRQALHINHERFVIGKLEKTLNIIIYPISIRNDIGVVIGINDISEQISLERQLMQSQKMEAIGSLAGGIAHDFNNILNIIIASNTLLKSGTTDPSILSRLQVIENASQRAADLVRQILVLSRNDTVRYDYVDFKTLLVDVMKMGKELFARSIHIHESLADQDFTMVGDRGQLSQVILNILVNARDAILLSKNCDQGLIRISLQLKPSDNYLIKLFENQDVDTIIELKISDNGCGMDKTTIDKIFDPFFSTKPVGKGTGLGLSVVYGIIKNHNGLIKVYSEQDRGTTFTVIFPCPKTIQSSHFQAEAKLHFGHGSIIFVDDEEDIVNTVKEMIESLGYNVFTFSDGYQAIDFYTQHYQSIDLAILDIMMPTINGIQLYQAMTKISDHLPVLFCSGYIDHGIFENLEDYRHKTRVLIKPYTMNELSEMIHETMALKSDC
ncbi:MAG: response regulator [Candidatus Delongbacteria bacterium]|nr:response regulator [Candidatus Delongbacteria bacterium]